MEDLSNVLIIENFGRNPVLLGRLYIFLFTTALGLVDSGCFCIALSAGQLPLKVSHPCTHSILLFRASLAG